MRIGTCHNNFGRRTYSGRSPTYNFQRYIFIHDNDNDNININAIKKSHLFLESL